MKAIKYIIAIFLIFLSCKSKNVIQYAKDTNNQTKVKTWRYDPMFDPAWYDTLVSHKQDIYNLWRKAPDPVKNFAKEPYIGVYNLFLSNEDFKNCEIIPIEVFTLKVEDFKRFIETDIVKLNDIITLKKDLATFFIVKNSKIYYQIKARLYNGSWIVSGYGPVFKNYSDSLSVPLIVEKKKVFSIYVPEAFSGTNFIVYKENKDIISFGYGGGRTNFIEEMKKNLNIK